MKHRAISFALLALAVGGCPRGSSTKAAEVCKQFGQQCQLEPGKLGSCSYRANCSGENCLYCQSQH
jgi:hypothetical protein